MQLPQEKCPAIPPIPDVTWPQAAVICVLSVVTLLFCIWFFRWVSSW